MQAHVQPQQQQQQQQQQRPEDDEEVDSLLGSFKAVQAQIHVNLGLGGSQAHAMTGSAAVTAAAATISRASTHELAASMAPKPTKSSAEIAELREIAQPVSLLRQGAASAGGSVGRGVMGASVGAGVIGGQGLECSPSKGKSMYVVAPQSGTRTSSAPSLLVHGINGSGPGALSLAAGTTREQLRYHYDIKAPSIEDEGYETALLAGRGGAAMPMPREQRPLPNAYEPIYRYPVDTGGDATFDTDGFVRRAQALGDDGNHWGLASDIIRQHMKGGDEPQIRGTNPGAAAKSAARSAVGRSVTVISSEGKAAGANGITGTRASGGGRGLAEAGAGQKVAWGSSCGDYMVPADARETGGAKIGDAKIGAKEKKPYGEDTCADGITMSLSSLKTQISAAGQTYTTSCKTIKEMQRGESMRATQRKTVTGKPGVANKVQTAFAKKEEEAVGEQPKTWAQKVKDMRKAASDIKPLVSMVGTIKSSPPKTRRPASAAAPPTAPASLAAAPSSAKSAGQQREGTAIRPASAAGGGRPSAAAAGSQGLLVDDRHALREGAPTNSTRAMQAPKRPPSAVPVAPMRAGASSQGGEGEYAANASLALDDETDGATANGYHHLIVGNAGGVGEDGIDMIDMYARDEVDMYAAMDMYARDEAIGARPKSRRGRGMNGRASSASGLCVYVCMYVYTHTHKDTHTHTHTHTHIMLTHMYVCVCVCVCVYFCVCL